MASFEGFLGQGPDGRARLFLRDDVERYVDFDPVALRAARCLEGAGEPLAVYRVELADEDAARPGQLDRHELSALFEPEPGDASERAARLAEGGHVGTYLVCDVQADGRWPASYDCETGFRRCYTIHIC